MTFGVILKPLGTNFPIEETTPLADLNAGRGVRHVDDPNFENLDAVQIAFRDGSSLAVNLYGAATVGQAMEKLQDASPEKLLVELVDTNGDKVKDSLKLTDRSSPSNEGVFTITGLNGSLAGAGLGLGILGNDEDSDGVTDGVIFSAPLHGQSQTDHFFLQDKPTIQANVGLSIPQDPGFNAQARLGMVGIAVDKGYGSANASIKLELKDIAGEESEDLGPTDESTSAS